MRQFPVPESDILCGLFCALSVITMLADREPVAVGLNVTFIVQVDFAVNELGQLFVSRKSR